MGEARTALSISRETLYKLLKAVELNSCFIGRRRYVTVKSVDAYIARGVEASRDPSGKLILDTRLDGFRGTRKAARLSQLALNDARGDNRPVVTKLDRPKVNQMYATAPPKPNSRIGQRVRVLSGAAAGRIGVIESADNANQFKVRFSPPVYIAAVGRVAAVWRPGDGSG